MSPLPSTLNAKNNNVQFQTRKINFNNLTSKLLVDRRKASVALYQRINELEYKKQVRLYKVYLKNFKRSK